MKKHTVLAIVLALSLLIGLLAGCGGTAPAADSATASAPEEAAEAAPAEAAPADQSAEAAPAEAPEEAASAMEAPEAPAEPEEPALEQVEYELPLFEDGATVSLWYPLRQDIVQAPEKASGGHHFWAQMQEDLNLHIDWVEPGQATASEKYNLMVASGDMTDLILETFCRSGDGGAYLGGYDKAIEDNIYLDLTDLVEEHCPNYWYWINLTDDNRRNAYTDSGAIGAFLTINGEKARSNQGIGVNKDLFEATGLPMPETMDEWSNMFAVLKDQGVQYPVSINSELAIMDGSAAAAMGAVVDTSFVLNRDNELVFGPTTDETRAYLELAADYYSKGYIDPDFINAGAFMDNSSFVSGITFVSRVMQQELAYYYDMWGVNVQAAPLPKADGAPETGMQLIQQNQALVNNVGMAVSTNCDEHLDTALLMMDWFYSPAGSIMGNYGLLDVTYNIVDGKPMINDFYQQRTDGIFNRGLYTVSGDFGLVWPNCSLTTAGELEQAAMDGWTPKEWDGYLYSNLPNIALTADESAAISNDWADIDTIVDSQFISWVVGSEPLNDDTWEAFKSNVDAQGLEACKDAYTAAFERFMSKG